jgi:hypothetical protein
MKPLICRNINGEQLRARLSPSARHLIQDSWFAGVSINLIAFPHEPSTIVTSLSASKSLPKLPANGLKTVVVGWDFTIEARQIFSQADAQVFFERDHGWTDDRWRYIKQL